MTTATTREPHDQTRCHVITVKGPVRTPYEIIGDIPGGDLLRDFTNGLREKLHEAADTLSLAEALAFIADYDEKVKQLPDNAGTPMATEFRVLYRGQHHVIPATIQGVHDFLPEGMRQAFTEEASATRSQNLDELLLDWIDKATDDDPAVTQARDRIIRGDRSASVTPEDIERRHTAKAATA